LKKEKEEPEPEKEKEVEVKDAKDKDIKVTDLKTDKTEKQKEEAVVRVHHFFPILALSIDLCSFCNHLTNSNHSI